MKTFTLLLAILLCYQKYASSQDGTLDLTFSSDGLDTVDFDGHNDFAYPALTQPDNKIIVAGQTYSGNSYDFAILRYNPDGSLDNTFNDDGKLVVDWLGGDDFANSIAIQTDGKILIAGSATAGLTNDFALMRLTAQGFPDSTFSDDGMLTTNVGSSGAPLSTLIQPDGKIILAGYSFNYNNDFTVIRYLSNGDPDSTFSSDGIAVTSLSPADDLGTWAILQPDQKILMAGYAINISNTDIAIARYNTDGTLDTSFNSVGYTLTDIANNNDYGRAIGLLPDNKIVVGGYTDNGFNTDFIAVRHHSNGLVDTSFGTNGRVTTDIDNGDDQAISMTIQPDNKIVLAGYANSVNNVDFALTRFNPDGSPDSSFAVDGKVITDFNGVDDFGSVITQGNGRLTLTGYTLTAGNTDFATASFVCSICSATGNNETLVSDWGFAGKFPELFPNPVINTATIRYPSKGESISLELFDLQGQLIRTFSKNHLTDGIYSEELNFANLTPGMYVLKLSTSNISVGIKVFKEVY